MNNSVWKSAITAGVVAGIVMLMLELIMNPLFLGSPIWGPPRMMAAIILGKGVLPPPATFDIGVILGAMLVHFILSIIFAIILALVIKKLSKSTAIIAGLVFGLLLYFINFYGFSSIFPWFAKARNWVQIVIHAVFGLTTALVFVSSYMKDTSTKTVA